MSLPEPVRQAVHARWRFRLAVATAVLALGAALAWVISLGYGEPVLVPVFLTLGVGCLAMAWHTVPRDVAPGERPRMAASAAWVVAAVVLYVVVPVVVGNLA